MNPLTKKDKKQINAFWNNWLKGKGKPTKSVKERAKKLDNIIKKLKTKKKR